MASGGSGVRRLPSTDHARGSDGERTGHEGITLAR